MQIAFALYPRFTALDIVGPFEVLGHLPGVEAHFVAASLAPVPNDNGRLALVPGRTWADLPAPDVLVVPGGDEREAARDEALLDWLRRAHEGTRWTASVCTGSVILGAAGLLAGLEATTHWSARERLEAHGASYRAERWVRQGRVVTAAGVSAGIDMALFLAGQLAGDEAAQLRQLVIEYDPAPPYDAGSVARAPASVVAAARRRLGPG